MSDIGNPPHGGGHPHGGHPHVNVPHSRPRGHIFTHGDYWPLYSVPIQPLSGCVSWGAPVAMTSDLAAIGRGALATSSGQPASATYNGTTYLFSVENGAMIARPCTMVS